MSRAGLLILALVVLISNSVVALPLKTSPYNDLSDVNVRSLDTPIVNIVNVIPEGILLRHEGYQPVNVAFHFTREDDFIGDSVTFYPRGIKSFFKNLGHKIKSGFQKAEHAITKGVKKGFEKVKHFAQTTGKKITKFGLEVGSAISGAISTVSKAVPGIGSAVSGALKGASVGLGKASDAIHAKLGKGLDKGISVLKKVADPIGAAIHAVKDKVKEKVL